MNSVRLRFVARNNEKLRNLAPVNYRTGRRRVLCYVVHAPERDRDVTEGIGCRICREF